MDNQRSIGRAVTIAGLRDEPKACRELSVPAALSQAQYAATNLNEVVKQLEVRLQTLLRPASPIDSSDEKNRVREPSCDMEVGINQITNVTNSSGQIVQDILNRLEV